MNRALKEEMQEIFSKDGEKLFSVILPAINTGLEAGNRYLITRERLNLFLAISHVEDNSIGFLEIYTLLKQWMLFHGLERKYLISFYPDREIIEIRYRRKNFFLKRLFKKSED